MAAVLFSLYHVTRASRVIAVDYATANQIHFAVD